MANLPARAIDRVICRNLGKLRKPGVLTVRPGFEIAGHQLTGRSAIVATVQQKRNDLSRRDLLPTRIAGVPVDVREATAHQRLRAHDPASARLLQAFGRPEEVDPEWPLERELPSGQLLTGKDSEHQRALQRHAMHQPTVAKTMAAQQSRPQLPYVAPAGASLVPMETTTTITVHVSPDAGFTQLSSFLEQTRESLVVGIYDFTSGPIVIDSSAVVISSQNFSPEGVRQNRDAGVIIESPAVARYFEEIFLSDWNTRAKPFAPAAAGTRKTGRSAPAAARKTVRRR
jgi:hypothetical protein